jgi:hypothetical protein
LHRFFFYWLTHYHRACYSHIQQVRESSPLTWEDARWLYLALAAYDGHHNKGALAKPTEAQIDEFLRWEMQNLSE